MSLPLIMCIAGAAVFIFVFFFYIVRISRLKKARAGSSLDVPRAPVSYKGSIVAAFVLEALPFAVPMELYMVAVSLACLLEQSGSIKKRYPTGYLFFMKGV